MRPGAGGGTGTSDQKVIPARDLAGGLLPPGQPETPQRQSDRDVFGWTCFEPFSGHHQVSHAEQEPRHARLVDLTRWTRLAVLDDQAHHQQQLLLAEDNVAAARFEEADRALAVRRRQELAGSTDLNSPQLRRILGTSGPITSMKAASRGNAVSMTSPDANSRTCP